MKNKHRNRECIEIDLRLKPSSIQKTVSSCFFILIKYYTSKNAIFPNIHTIAIVILISYNKQKDNYK